MAVVGGWAKRIGGGQMGYGRGGRGFRGGGWVLNNFDNFGDRGSLYEETILLSP